MHIQYFNAFLCRNGEKTNYDLSKLIDKIRVSSPVERTVKLGSQQTIFMNDSREPLFSRTSGSSLDGFEYLPSNRTVWIGKYRSEKPYEGKIGEEEIRQIDGDLFEPSVCLIIPTSYLFLMERKFLGPSINQIGEYLSSFIKSNDPNVKYSVKFEPMKTDSLKPLIEASESIKSIEIQIKNEGFQLSNLFPNINDSNKTLLEKLFGNMIEVSEELDINTTTVVFKKSRYKREMDIKRVDGILKLLNSSDKNLISAKVEFLNPETHRFDEVDLKKDGFYILEKTSLKTENFDKLANLMTEHYYDDQNSNKDLYYTSFGSLLSVNESEFKIVTENSI
ncbi:DUF6731 family protein [Streptococcus mitis]|uniref:DUF6731 family protein n=1 Tax=Streptococcus mitis TaxID=28037 RepID=UPI0020019724|nr:DUF6731 family protein [Streptococcus mitis]